MKHMGYVSATVGNHEFNYGPAVFKKFQDEGGLPYALSQRHRLPGLRLPTLYDQGCGWRAGGYLGLANARRGRALGAA